MLHKPLFLPIHTEPFLAVGFLWLESYIYGSSQTAAAAGTSLVLILGPCAPKNSQLCLEATGPGGPRLAGHSLQDIPTCT